VNALTLREFSIGEVNVKPADRKCALTGSNRRKQQEAAGGSNRKQQEETAQRNQ